MLNAVSLGATVTSGATSVKGVDKASILVEWSAGTSPVGTITVEARNGDGDGQTAPTWYELDMGSAISVSGSSGNHQLVFNELPFTDLRIKYTRSSGTATMTATITMKAVGA